MSINPTQPPDPRAPRDSGNGGLAAATIAQKADDACAKIESAAASFYRISDANFAAFCNSGDKTEHLALLAAKIRTENELWALWPLEIDGTLVETFHPESVRVEHDRSKALRAIHKTFIVIENIFSGFIENPSTAITLDEALDELNGFIARHPGQSISKELLLGFFPQLGLSSTTQDTARRAVLPPEAPEKYQGLRGPETPPAFVQRVYGEWLGHGLTRAHIRKLDPKLYDAINNWLSRPGNEWPADVDLPTLKELNDRWADRIQKEGFAPVSSEGEPGFALREIDRLRGVIQRRQEK